MAPFVPGKSGRQVSLQIKILLVIGICLVFGGLSAAVLLAGQTFGAGLTIYATPVEVSFPAPALVLQDISGQPISLASTRGKVVLLNNWATWCPPCKQEMPDLQRYYKAHQQDDFVLIAVDQSDPVADVEAFVAKYGLTFPVWMDPGNLTLTAFSNNALPNSYVIDRSGIVRLAWTGAVDLKTLEKYVTPLLEEK